MRSFNSILSDAGYDDTRGDISQILLVQLAPLLKVDGRGLHDGKLVAKVMLKARWLFWEFVELKPESGS
jgi:hypothetical protein